MSDADAHMVLALNNAQGELRCSGLQKTRYVCNPIVIGLGFRGAIAMKELSRSLTVMFVLNLVWPAEALERSAPTFYICSRAGCTVTVKTQSGKDSSQASAVGYMTEADAIAWCTEYERPAWPEEGGVRWLAGCVKGTLDSDGGKRHLIMADCSAGTLFAPDGTRWRLTEAGRRGSDEPHEYWRPINRKLLPNERTPFEANGSQFTFLCPEAARKFRIE